MKKYIDLTGSISAKDGKIEHLKEKIDALGKEVMQLKSKIKELIDSGIFPGLGASPSASNSQEKLLEAVDSLTDAGFVVKAFVGDQGHSNRKMVEILSDNSKKE